MSDLGRNRRLQGNPDAHQRLAGWIATEERSLYEHHYSLIRLLG
jgi:hypothetical protein